MVTYDTNDFHDGNLVVNHEFNIKAGLLTGAQLCWPYVGREELYRLHDSKVTHILLKHLILLLTGSVPDDI